MIFNMFNSGCKATRQSHCCHIRGKQCEHVIFDHTDENGVFREVACGLRAELGSWDKVLEDPRYPANSWAPGINCRDWPNGMGVNGDYCSRCKVNPHMKRGNYVDD